MSSIPNGAPNLLTASGAITSLGFCPITVAGVGVFTLALPVVDNQSMIIQDTTGHAHTVTTPTAGINGLHVTLTFGGTVAQFVELHSYNGTWYVQAQSGVTIS
jgi:hypothetical protein